MTRVIWDPVGERYFQTGVDRGVLYPQTGGGVPWNGLIGVNETPSGGDAKTYYIDGYMYSHRAAQEIFQGSIDAFTYPKEFEACDGTVQLARGLQFTQQRRSSFGLSYRSRVGNDLSGIDYGYKIHLVYNALVTPSERNNKAISDSPEAIEFNWSFTCKPYRLLGYQPIPHVVVDSNETMPSLMAAIEDILYGSDTASPRLPTPSELKTLFEGWPEMVVMDNGNGTFTVDGPPHMVSMLNSTTYQITSPTAIVDGDGPFTVSSS